LDKLKAVIIGVGRIGFSLQFDKKREQPAAHSLALLQNKNIEIIGACDLDKEKLVKWKRFYKNANIYSDYKKLLIEEKPDVVVIAVNECAHLEIALETIKTKPRLIILEKPVAPNLKEAKIIKDFAEKNSITVSVNHERRFAADYNIVKDYIKKDYLGNIHSVFAGFWSNLVVYEKNAEKTGACSLIHDGTHLIDILHYLFDIELKKPVIDNICKNDKGEVKSVNLHFTKKLNNDDQKTIFYVEMNGLKKYFGFEIEIRGSKGRIIIGNGYLKYYETKPSPFYTNFYSLVKNKDLKRPKKTLYFTNMVTNCVNNILKKEKLVSPLEEGLKTLKVLFAIIKKIR